MIKYEPLRRYLRRHRGAAVELTFADIERIIRAILPKAADDPAWWANVATRPRGKNQCQAWLDAGYHAVPSGRESIRFVPLASASAFTTPHTPGSSTPE